MRPRFPILRLDHVLSEALGFVARNLPMVLGLGLLLVGLPEFLFDAATILAPRPPGEGNYFASVGVEAIRSSLFHGGIAYLFWQELEGRRVSWRELLTPGGAILAAMLATGVVMNLVVEAAIFAFGGLGAAVGQPLLFLAGALVWPFVGLAIVTTIVERPGFGRAFSRAFQLSRRARLPLLGLFLLYMAFAMSADWLAVEAGLGTYYSSERPFGLVPALLTCAIASTLSDLYLAAVAAAAYFELRRLKEALPPDDPSMVFE